MFFVDKMFSYIVLKLVVYHVSNRGCHKTKHDKSSQFGSRKNHYPKNTSRRISWYFPWYLWCIQFLVNYTHHLKCCCFFHTMWHHFTIERVDSPQSQKCQKCNSHFFSWLRKISGWWFQSLWKIRKSVGMMTFPAYGKIKMFQTINQLDVWRFFLHVLRTSMESFTINPSVFSLSLAIDWVFIKTAFDRPPSTSSRPNARHVPVRYVGLPEATDMFFHHFYCHSPITYWCVVGNGWEWGNGMIITSDYGSLPSGKQTVCYWKWP